jgi:hypothetical protein
MVDIQTNNRNRAILVVVVATLLGILCAWFLGWSFGFAVGVLLVDSDSSSRPWVSPHAAYKKFNIACLLGDYIMAVVILMLAFGGYCCWFEAKRNRAASCNRLGLCTLSLKLPSNDKGNDGTPTTTIAELDTEALLAVLG